MSNPESKPTGFNEAGFFEASREFKEMRLVGVIAGQELVALVDLHEQARFDADLADLFALKISKLRSRIRRTDQPPVEAAVLAVMQRWRREGALWTSDIADGVKIKTAKVRASLVRLEAAGKVRRVVAGNPTSWELVNGE